MNIVRVIEIIGLSLSLLTGVLTMRNLVRSSKRIKYALMITGVLALIGLVIRSPSYQLKGANVADTLLSPFICILLYAIARYVFLKIYKREPTMRDDIFEGIDDDTGRKISSADIIVHLIPFFISIFFPFIIRYCF